MTSLYQLKPKFSSCPCSSIMTRTIGGKALCYLNERRWNCSARKVSLDISEWGAMGIEFLLVTFMDERLAGR